MKTKLIVHIGLPKTATTTLQKNVFEKLHGNTIDFLGVYQPRNRHQDKLFQEIMTCLTRPAVFKKNLLNLKKLLRERLDASSMPIVISEEVISVDGSEATWQEKYYNLAELLTGVEYKILVSVREPIAAIYSMYVELYENVNIQYPTLVDFYKRNNTVKIYRYGSFYECLVRCFGANNLVFIQHENLNEPELFLRQLEKVVKIDKRIEIKLGNENRKKKIGHGYFAQDKSLIETTRAKIEDALKNILLPNFLRLFLRSINHRFMKSRIMKRRVLVPFPSEKDCRFLQDQLLEENLVFAKKTGIHYENLHEILGTK